MVAAVLLYELNIFTVRKPSDTRCDPNATPTTNPQETPAKRRNSREALKQHSEDEEVSDKGLGFRASNMNPKTPMPKT